MACGLMLAALRLLLDGLTGLTFSIHCKSDEFHLSACNEKKTDTAAHRLTEVHPFRLDFEWRVECGGCSARRLVARAEAEEIVCTPVTGLYMGSL